MKTLILALLFPIFLYSQENLVVDGNFEDYKVLPENVTFDGMSYLKSWTVPNMGTPDYYHLDCDSSYKEIVINELGEFPLPNSGRGFIGMISISLFGGMEHITGTLKSPLKKGHEYLVTISIRICETCEYMSSNFGILFTTNRINFNTNYIPEYIALNNSMEDSYLRVPLNELAEDSTWKTLTVIYKSTGAEKFLTIGSFLNKKENKELKKHQELFFISRERSNDYINNSQVLLKRNRQNDKEIVPGISYFFVDNIKILPKE